MFLVLQGKVEIYVKNIKTATVGPKNAIGDLALETGNLRKATVKAKTDLFLLTVQGNDYNEILLDQKQWERREILKFLKSLFCFKNMLYSKLVTIADNIIPSFYTSEVKIYEIGQESTDFYIIREGVVQLETEITLTKVNKLPIKQVLISTKKYNYQIQECKAGNIIGIEEIFTSEV